MLDRQEKKDKGFSLIDLLIVVLIMGMLAMIVIPQYQTIVSDAKLDSAAGEIVSALQYAGNIAIRYQRPFGFKSDAAGNTFRVYDYQYKDDSAEHINASPPTGANGVVLNPVDKKWYIRNYNIIKNFEGVSITGGEIQFYPDGHSTSNDSTFTVQYAGKQKIIIVSGTTGRISVQ